MTFLIIFGLLAVRAGICGCPGLLLLPGPLRGPRGTAPRAPWARSEGPLALRACSAGPRARSAGPAGPLRGPAEPAPRARGPAGPAGPLRGSAGLWTLRARSAGLRARSAGPRSGPCGYEVMIRLQKHIEQNHTSEIIPLLFLRSDVLVTSSRQMLYFFMRWSKSS